MFSGRWSQSAMWREQLGWTALRILLPWLLGAAVIALYFDRAGLGALPAIGAVLALLGLAAAGVLIANRWLPSAAREGARGPGPARAAKGPPPRARPPPARVAAAGAP